jgi:hypothetical protein
MGKMIAFFAGIFILGIVFSGMSGSGSSSMASTYITQNVSPSDTTIYVADTTGFLDEDNIYIGNEQILYTSLGSDSFGDYLNVPSNGRGYNGTDATAHVITPNNDPAVYNESSDIINESLGVNLSDVVGNNGVNAIWLIPWRFFSHALPAMLTMQFSFFSGDMAIVGYMFLACSIGLVITVAMSMLWVAAGVIKIL